MGTSWKPLVISLVFLLLLGGLVGLSWLRLQRPHTIESTPTVSSTPSPSEHFSKFGSLLSPAIYDNIHFIVGEFRDWEEIEDSDNRYILLTNPTTKQNYPKIRVILEPRDPYKSYKIWEGMTAFAVEKTEKEHDDLGYLKDFTSEEINKLVKKGDLIKIVFEKESMIEKPEEDAEDLGAEDLKGKTNDFLAFSISIKRTEGKVAVEKELGRKIQ